MAKRSDITPELCRQLLRYEPETGKLFWKWRDPKIYGVQSAIVFNDEFSGKEAGNTRRDGYIMLSILGVLMCAHRVAYAIMTGRWPIEIDHDDRDPSNNRWGNIFDTTHHQNMKNLSSRKDARPHIGVWWQESIKKWRAVIGVNGKSHHLGSYSDINDAIAARKAAEKVFGFHPGHGSIKKKSGAKVYPSRRP